MPAGAVAIPAFTAAFSNVSTPVALSCGSTTGLTPVSQVRSTLSRLAMSVRVM